MSAASRWLARLTVLPERFTLNVAVYPTLRFPPFLLTVEL